MKPGLEEEAETTVRGLLSAFTSLFPEEVDMDKPTILQIRERPSRKRCQRKPTSTDRGLYGEMIRLALINHDIDPESVDYRLRNIRTPRQLARYIAENGKTLAEIARDKEDEARCYYEEYCSRIHSISKPNQS